MPTEIRHLLWLQWHLTLAMFRSRRAEFWARLGRILLAVVMLVFSLPFFIAMALALGVGIAVISTPGALELALIANSLLFGLWLLLPASYSSSILERFEMRRLFVQPVSFRGLVAGSTIISVLSLTGVWTVLILVGESVALLWHRPLALPLILLGAVPTFAAFILVGRVMEDLFDLVATDRRLRGALLFLFTLPFLLLAGCNWVSQIVAQNTRLLEPFLGDLPPLEGLAFPAAVDTLLTHIRLSRYLLWLPMSWGTAAMGYAGMGRWVASLGFLVLASGFAGLLLWVHASLTRRMMRGQMVRLGAEKVHSQRLARRLPGPPELWALVLKDWTSMRRSPITKRVLIGTPILAASLGFAVWQINQVAPLGGVVRAALPMLAVGVLLVSVSLAVSNFAANPFGSIDREGFATLALSPVDRRLVLLANNLVTTALALAVSLFLLLVVVVASGDWLVLPLGLLMALAMHVSLAPPYTFAAIIGPYRDQMESWGQAQGSLWLFAAWLLGTPPVLMLFLVPYLFWRPGLLLTVPLAIAYAGVLYVATLGPLARLLDRRADRILAVVGQES